MNLLTREEIIKIWRENDKYNNFYCCPDCRDILKFDGVDSCHCQNLACSNSEVYKLEDINESE